MQDDADPYYDRKLFRVYDHDSEADCAEMCTTGFGQRMLNPATSNLNGVTRPHEFCVSYIWNSPHAVAENTNCYIITAYGGQDLTDLTAAAGGGATHPYDLLSDYLHCIKDEGAAHCPRGYVGGLGAYGSEGSFSVSDAVLYTVEEHKTATECASACDALNRQSIYFCRGFVWPSVVHDVRGDADTETGECYLLTESATAGSTIDLSSGGSPVDFGTGHLGIDQNYAGHLFCEKTPPCPAGDFGGYYNVISAAFDLDWNGLQYTGSTSTSNNPNNCASGWSNCDGDDSCLGFLHSFASGTGKCYLLEAQSDTSAFFASTKNFQGDDNILFCKKKDALDWASYECPTGYDEAVIIPNYQQGSTFELMGLERGDSSADPEEDAASWESYCHTGLVQAQLDAGASPLGFLWYSTYSVADGDLCVPVRAANYDYWPFYEDGTVGNLVVLCLLSDGASAYNDWVATGQGLVGFADAGEAITGAGATSAATGAAATTGMTGGAAGEIVWADESGSGGAEGSGEDGSGSGSW